MEGPGLPARDSMIRIITVPLRARPGIFYSFIFKVHL